MIFTFGNRSETKLATADPELAEVPRLVLSHGVFDLTIVWAYHRRAANGRVPGRQFNEENRVIPPGDQRRETLGAGHRFRALVPTA